MDAFARILEAAESIGFHAVEVHAKSEVARRFYEKYGFTALLDDCQHLYMALSTVRSALT